MTKLFNLEHDYELGISYAAQAIQRGGLVVFPTETVYGLGADALNQTAVSNIFEAKGRPADNPLIVHIHSLEQAYELAEVSPRAKELMQAFWPGPFTLILPKKTKVPSVTTGGLDTVAIRMPNNRAALSLLRTCNIPIAAPSANTSGKPSPTRVKHVIEDMFGRVDVILDGGDCDFGLESTVVKLTGDKCSILRPGAVTQEMLSKYIEAEISDNMLNHDVAKPESPGMKYKHYAPNAKVYVVDTQSDVAKKIISLYDIDVLRGLRSLILCVDDHAPRYGKRRSYKLGSDNNAVAKNLYAALRYADEMKCDKVYFEAVSSDGMGMAIMNRVLRAAEFTIIKDD